MLPLFYFALIIGGSQALPSADQFIDNVLHSALQNVIKSERLDPTFLPDYTFDYYDKTFFGKVHGKAEYSQGSLKGLSKIVRLAGCQGPANFTGATSINCTLAFNVLETYYKGKVKYGVLPKVSIDAKGNTSVIVNVDVSKGYNDRQAKVKSLTIRSARRPSTQFSGLGPLNKHMKVLEENYKNKVSEEVSRIILNRFQYALNLAVGQVPMPLR